MKTVCLHCGAVIYIKPGTQTCICPTCKRKFDIKICIPEGTK
jgi:hypothetical protein